ncbi:MAG: hypothetical protein JKY22_01190 [Flavobacteriaceae bacterium]|nr:hypothetical protein [Flavobacteriaceae bacterium]
MKKFALIIILLAGLNSVTAQEFEITSAYNVSINGSLNEQELVQNNATLSTDVERSITLTTFPVEAAESLTNIVVSELQSPKLEGVTKVLKIEASYVEYCSYLVSQYILITTNGDYISLPSLGNTHCNDTLTEVRYLFPNQKFGKANQIVRAEVSYTKTAKVSTSITQQIFIWNDDDFGTMGAISENY